MRPLVDYGNIEEDIYIYLYYGNIKSALMGTCGNNERDLMGAGNVWRAALVAVLPDNNCQSSNAGEKYSISEN